MYYPGQVRSGKNVLSREQIIPIRVPYFSTTIQHNIPNTSYNAIIIKMIHIVYNLLFYYNF